MDVHDQMRQRFREEIEQLSKRYSHGDRSRRAQAVLNKIHSLERARLMWGISWSRYKEQGEAIVLQNYLTGVEITIEAVSMGNKKALPGWKAARSYAEDILKMTSA